MSDVNAQTQAGRGPARGIPRVRRGETTRFAVDGQKGYLSTGMAADGELGEVSLRIAKQGSTLAGAADALGTAMSLGLQAGVPVHEFVAEFANTRFAPAGRTDDPDLPQASSIMDYVARRLAIDVLPPGQRAGLGI
jgi:ribonucleoside-diphosphate reductase alpha chain